MDDTRDEVGEILAGMTGGRTGTAGGVSSPVPPAADWPRGLDAASASAAQLTMLLSDVYKAHQGKEPSGRACGRRCRNAPGRRWAWPGRSTGPARPRARRST